MTGIQQQQTCDHHHNRCNGPIRTLREEHGEERLTSSATLAPAVALTDIHPQVELRSF